jgi:hypothetical protein
MLSREERWWIFKIKHNENGWTLPWDRMVFPSHEFFNKYTKVYGTDINISIPSTIEECNKEELEILEILKTNNL